MRLFKSSLSLILSIILVFSLSLPAFAIGKKRTVRVADMDIPGFATHDENGNHYGYGVEYLEEICKYVNWEVEFVHVPREAQFELLDKGELDLVPLVQYAPDRAEKYGFPLQSMGYVKAFIYVSDSNKDIYYEDFEALNGKTIGVLKNSLNAQKLSAYAEQNNFSYKEKSYLFHSELQEALSKGEVDAIASEQLTGIQNARIVADFLTEPSFIVCRKDDSELLEELNFALNSINNNDIFFRYNIYKKYYGNDIAFVVPNFTKKEAEFIQNAGTVNFAVVDENQPVAFTDEEGVVRGITPDILDEISRLSGIPFTYSPMPIGVPPIKYIDEHPETIVAGVLSTNPALKRPNLLLSDTMYDCYTCIAVISGRFRKVDLENGHYTIGVKKSFQAQQLFIKENYPNLTLRDDFETLDDGLKALSNGEIDLFTHETNAILRLTGSERFSNVSIIANSFMDEPHCILAKDNSYNRMLMGIINKCIGLISDDTIEEIETENLRENIYQPTLSDSIHKARLPLICIALIVAFAFAFLSYKAYKDRMNSEEINKKNAQLIEAVNMVTRANEAKSDFLSRMSHDIRTPMNAIMGMTLMAKHENKDNPKIDEYLDKIGDSSQLLLDLLNSILDSAALESGKLKLVCSPFDPVTELSKVTDMYIPQCEKKEINYSVNFDCMSKVTYMGDALRLSQVVLNLISNAYKFTDNGGKISFAAGDTDAPDGKKLLTIVVSDTGCGMSDELLDRLYNPFEQADATTAHKFGGSGLGLNIVKNLVTMMGGTVEVKSALDKGTSFTVKIPFAVAEEENSENSDNKADTKKDNFDFTGKRILVADDDSYNCDVVDGLLAMANAETVCVANGKLAVETFEYSTVGYFDAILMDVHMPVMGGYEASLAIRKLSKTGAKDIPIFALTADAFPDDIQKAKESGMNGHLSKPIYPDVLYRTLSDAFEKKNNP